MRVLLVFCDNFNGYENVDCRWEFYEIFIYFFKNKGMDKE